MLRTVQSLPLAGLSTLGFDPTRFQTEPPVCYRASWQLPGPDFHRQATTRTNTKITPSRHEVTSGSAGRTRERGYPVGDFDQQARAVSVDHADVVSEYHAAHDISQRTQRGEPSTEQLREAMVHYRTLFAEFLDDGGGSAEGRADTRNERA